MNEQEEKETLAKLSDMFENIHGLVYKYNELAKAKQVQLRVGMTSFATNTENLIYKLVESIKYGDNKFEGDDEELEEMPVEELLKLAGYDSVSEYYEELDDYENPEFYLKDLLPAETEAWFPSRMC